MSGVPDPLAWVALAEEDYTLARSCLRRRTPLLYGACFHAQQAAENYFKAVLIARGHTFPRIHDLVRLNAYCAQTGSPIPIPDADLDLLGSHAVEVRYPGVAVTVADARQAVSIAGAVRRAARRELGLP
jgi:HEPN domain-containing protein